MCDVSGVLCGVSELLCGPLWSFCDVSGYRPLRCFGAPLRCLVLPCGDHAKICVDIGYTWVLYLGILPTVWMFGQKGNVFDWCMYAVY